MEFEPVKVECYSGYKADEKPVVFFFRGYCHEIVEIIDRWYEGGIDPSRPQIDYFKVKTAKGEIFLLRYSHLFNSWSVKI